MMETEKSQTAVCDWLKKHQRSATSAEVGEAFGKSTRWAYKILASLEDAYRIAANTGHPIRWWVLELRQGEQR